MLKRPSTVEEMLLKLEPKYRALISYNNHGVEQSFALHLILTDIWNKGESKKDIPATILNDIRNFQKITGIQLNEGAIGRNAYHTYTITFMSFYDKDDVKAIIIEFLMSYGLTKEDIKFL